MRPTAKFIQTVCLLSLVSAPPLWAQKLTLNSSELELTERIEEAESAEEPSEEAASEEESSAPGATAKKTTPEEQAAQKLAQELMQTKFQRTPSAILKAQIPEIGTVTIPNLPGTTTPPPTAGLEKKEFTRHILTGDWKAVGEILKKLPEPQCRQVFGYLLQQLQAPLPQQRQNRQQMGKQDLQVFMPTEIAALADAFPHEIKDGELDRLAGLLRQSLAQDFPHQPLIDILTKGTRTLGGEDPARKLLAARLLSTANLPREATRFLPTLDEARKAKDSQAMLIHAQALLQQAKDDSADAPKLASWGVVLEVFTIAELKPEHRSAALQQCLGLMDEVPPDARRGFLKNLVLEKTMLAQSIIAAAAERQGGMASQGNVQSRGQALQLLKEISDLVLTEVKGDAQKSWHVSLNSMTLPWLDEAGIVAQQQENNQQGGYYDENGNYYPSQRQTVRYVNGRRIVSNSMGSSGGGGNRQSVAPDDMLKFAPNGQWRALLEPSLRQRIVAVLPKIALAAEQDELVIQSIADLAPNDKAAAAVYVGQYLQTWGQKRNPSAHYMRNRYNRYYSSGGMYYGGQQPAGIPITRALQERNVVEMAKLLADLRKLPIDPVDPDVLSNTFSAMHSEAEVYRADDIQNVFGKPDEMDAEILTNLIDTMRQRLATVWRQAKTQEQSRTKRSEKEMNEEVQRGYDVATGLANGALTKNPENWRFHMIRAALAFDWAEFKYGQKSELQDYVEKREEAFGAFAKAAELYAKIVPSLKPLDYEIGAYAYWFNANLGASDLSYVTRQQQPSEKSLARIQRAILELPGEAAQKHLDMFAETLNGGVGTLPPHLKQPYVDATVQVIGKEHPKAKEALELQRFYAEVGSEVEFSATVDGDTNVGQRPFGVFVTLRYTVGVGREADGFRKYLTNQTQNQNYYNPMGTPPQDYRDQFEKQVKETFADGFDVLSLTFADPKEQPRLYGREGWRETPYAYILAKSKQPTVDQIPALKLDVDFADNMGQVVLPKVSSVVAIDSKSATPPRRPLGAMTITQTLDERESAAGKLSLEIKATGQGVIPALEEILLLDFPGFTIKEKTDPGLSLSKLTTLDDGMAVLSERNWVLTLERIPTEAPMQFTFPVTAAGVTATVSRKMYADADLVDAPEVVKLAAVPAQTWQAWLKQHQGLAIGAGGGLLGLIALLFYMIFRSKTPRTIVGPRHALPSQITPFSVISLLRRLESDPALKLNESRREELRRSIAELEQSYFAPAASAPPSSGPDLGGLARQWLQTAGI